MNLQGETVKAVGPHHQAVCCLGTPAGSDLEELSGACSGSGCSEACSKSGQGGDGPKDQPTPVQAPARCGRSVLGHLCQKSR